MRSFLTVLGVIIGTGAVIGVGSIIAGPGRRHHRTAPQLRPEHRDRLQDQRRHRATSTREERAPQAAHLENARAIAERCPAVEHVSPYLFADRAASTRARYKGNDMYNIQTRRHRRRLRRRRHHHEVRPLLHRHGEPPSHAGRGDRRGRAEAVVAERGPDRQVDRGGRPRAGGRRRDGPARGVAARARTTRASCSRTSPCARCSPTRRSTC